MDQQMTIEKTKAYVKAELSGEGSGHDWFHVERVWKNAVNIAKEEQADLLVVELAALLHDIADWKFHDGDLQAGPKKARAWLESLQVDDSIIRHVEDIIVATSFKGKGVHTPLKSKEAMIVQDADRLDALGAVGIARTFAYGGSQGREIYNPEQKPENHESFEQYKNSKGHTINHFYEKLLLLKGLMNTETARRMAEERHQFMEKFLDQFYREWNTDLQ